MMVTIEQFERGILNYYESEIAQKATGIGQFAAYFLAPSIPNKVSKKVEELRKSGMVDDIINADGLIDIDLAHKRALDAFEHCKSIELFGFKFNASDANKLYEAIERA